MERRKQSTPVHETGTQTSIVENPMPHQKVVLEAEDGFVEENGVEKVYIEDDEDDDENDVFGASSVHQKSPVTRCDTYDLVHTEKSLKTSSYRPSDLSESDSELKPKLHYLSSSDRSSPEVVYSHRKSVSFDLSGDERSKSDFERSYSPDPNCRTRLYDSEQEHMVRKEKSKIVPKKGILRSASPSSANSTLEKVEKPILRVSRTMEFETIVPTKTDSHIYTEEDEGVCSSASSRLEKVNSDDELERDNPFREAFLSKEQKGTYEELAKKALQAKNQQKSIKATRDHFVVGKPHQDKGLLSKSSENLLDEKGSKYRQSPIYKSEENMCGRPSTKPPAPPKSKIKQASVVPNVALEKLQHDMDHGDFIEYEHNIETNTIREIPKTGKSKLYSDFDQKSSLSSISSKKYIRSPSSITRPRESPPPPPVNLATMPSFERLKPFEEDSNIIEIIPIKVDVPSTAKRKELVHENCPDNILVPEEIHRTILLKENEIRNVLRDTSVSSGADIDSFQLEQEEQQSQVKYSQYQPKPVTKHSVNPFLSSFDNSCENISQINNIFFTQTEQSQNEGQQENEKQQEYYQQSICVVPTTKIFPSPQILPVQYTSLPIPQQPQAGGLYHLTHDHQLCNSVHIGCCTSSPTGYTSTSPSSTVHGYSSFMVSESNQQPNQILSQTFASYIPQHQQPQQQYFLLSPHNNNISNNNSNHTFFNTLPFSFSNHDQNIILTNVTHENNEKSIEFQYKKQQKIQESSSSLFDKNENIDSNNEDNQTNENNENIFGTMKSSLLSPTKESLSSSIHAYSSSSSATSSSTSTVVNKSNMKTFGKETVV